MTADSLLRLFRIHDQVWRVNLKDVTQEESLRDPRPAGNCLNWVAGHLVFSRNHVLQLLGREPVWSDERAKVYERGSAVLDPDDALDLDEIRTLWKTAQKGIVAGLREIGVEQLTAESPAQAFGSTVGDDLAGLQFHESYHLGQLGLLRRLAGKEGAIA